VTSSAVRVGVISDTHGLLRPEAENALLGSDFIVHAGDIGDAGILGRLSAIAPTTAVRGNNDVDPWALHIAKTELLQVGGVRIHVIHDIADLLRAPSPGSFDVVVSGHSHRPRVEWRDGILYLNPGSAGPRRFRLPISLARLDIVNDTIIPTLLELSAGSFA
jgi:uncharacterized protein